MGGRRDETVSNRTVLALIAVEFTALGSLAAPLTLGLALKATEIRTEWTPEQTLSLVTALGAASALVANPAFGALGDRWRDREPGRALWVLLGVLGGVAAVFAVVRSQDLVTLTVGWCLAQAAFNATFAGLYGLIGDHVPERDRPRVSGWFGAAALFSVVAALGMAAVLPKEAAWVMAPMPILAVPTACFAFRHLRRLTPSSAEASPRVQAGRRTASRDYWLVWIQRALVQLAYGLMAGYGLFFLMRRGDLPQDAAATWVAVTAALAALVSAAASAWCGHAARHGRYTRPVVVAVVLLAGAATLKSISVAPVGYVLAMLVAGAGIGAYYAVDLALVLRTIPAGRAGLFLGWFNIARTLPQSLAPAVAPALLAIGGRDLVGSSSQNYAALYGAGALIALISLVPLRWIRTLDRPTPVERVTPP